MNYSSTMSPGQIFRIIHNIACALKELHAKSFYHQNIKVSKNVRNL